MGKGKSKRDNDNEYPGDNTIKGDTKFAQSQGGSYKQSAKVDEVEIVFKQNRKFHLHVGRKTWVFIGKSSHIVPRKVLEHSDFLQQSKYFLIKE